jgi:hypothetical protein
MAKNENESGEMKMKTIGVLKRNRAAAASGVAAMAAWQ